MSDSVSTRVITKIVAAFIVAAAAVVVFSGLGIKAQAAELIAPRFKAEQTYETEYSHPYNRQTNTIYLHWYGMTNAVKYEIYIAGGRYSGWHKYMETNGTACAITGLDRATTYKFTARAVLRNGGYSYFATPQYIKTARFNYDADGWEAMCRIVYHEVGGIDDSMWDEPIVYVADCVSNRYTCARYAPQTIWYSWYRNYANVQQMIYNSGEFMSSYGLSRDGASYSRVPTKVKLAVWGATYAKVTYKGIVNDCNVFFWCNTGYSTSSSKIAYSYRIPWGYFYIWRSYWG